MVMRQLKQADYDRLVCYLHRCAQSDVFGTEYQIALTADGARYLLRLRPDSRCRVYLLSAICEERGGRGAAYRQETACACQTLMDLIVGHAKLYGLRNAM